MNHVYLNILQKNHILTLCFATLPFSLLASLCFTFRNRGPYLLLRKYVKGAFIPSDATSPQITYTISYQTLHSSVCMISIYDVAAAIYSPPPPKDAHFTGFFVLSAREHRAGTETSEYAWVGNCAWEGDLQEPRIPPPTDTSKRTKGMQNGALACHWGYLSIPTSYSPYQYRQTHDPSPLIVSRTKNASLPPNPNPMPCPHQHSLIAHHHHS